jgi:hypothetical protein
VALCLYTTVSSGVLEVDGKEGLSLCNTQCVTLLICSLEATLSRTNAVCLLI